MDGKNGSSLLDGALRLARNSIDILLKVNSVAALRDIITYVIDIMTISEMLSHQ